MKIHNQGVMEVSELSSRVQVRRVLFPKSPPLQGEQIVDKFTVQATESALVIAGVMPSAPGPQGEVTAGRYVYDSAEVVAARLAGLSERATGIRTELTQALRSLDSAGESLKVVAESPNIGQAEAARQAVIVATERLAVLRTEQASHAAAIAAEIATVQEVQRRLVDELAKEPEREGPPRFRDPRQQMAMVSADLDRTHVALDQLRAAEKNINALPMPSRGLADMNWSLSGSLGAAVPGLASVAVDGGIRVGQESLKNGERPVYPFVAVFGSTPVGGGSYMVSSEPGHTGPGFSASFLPYTSVGWSAANGRSIGISVPGLFGVGFRERGEVGLSLNFPISPFLRAGFVTVAGHPMLNTVIAPVLNVADGATFQVEELVAQLQLWVRAQLSEEEEPQG